MKKKSLLCVAVLSVLLCAHLSMAQSPIKVNEIYSRGVAGNLDWVEMYNTSAASVDISGYKIYDAGGKTGTKPKKLFPTGTILPAKGFTVIIVDTASFTGDLSGFGLGSGGDSVWVENAAGTLIDSVFIPALGVDTTYARIPDGSNALVKATPATKGSSNVLVKMNEVYTRGVAGNLDWIEMYNTLTTQIDISGYKIYDNGGRGGTKPKKLFPTGTILPAKGFFLIVVDTASYTGDLSGFGLGSGGDTVWVENTAGIVIDSVYLPALGVDTTYARKPDGSNLFVKSSPATKGATNGPATSVRSNTLFVSDFVLNQNFPNPFNPTTTISYQLTSKSMVSLRVYDLLGKEIAELVNEQKEAGSYSVQFNARNLASGIYMVGLKAGNYSEMKKMTLIR
ncbi:MAG: lamin tail domain-containing protein [Ignavibacteriales bacterium]|nr:lamin tail domain-containing protein [Ignavibacteriales bacterium]